MTRYVPYFLAAITATLLSVLVNNLPDIPDTYKPWVPLGVFVLTIFGASLVIWQNQANGSSSKRRVVRNNTLEGDGSKILVREDSETVGNKLKGKDASIVIEDDGTGSGRNP
jgi:hypothetical protein